MVYIIFSVGFLFNTISSDSSNTYYGWNTGLGITDILEWVMWGAWHAQAPDLMQQREPSLNDSNTCQPQHETCSEVWKIKSHKSLLQEKLLAEYNFFFG